MFKTNRDRLCVVLIAVVLSSRPANGAKSTMVPMRDGVTLRTIISLPGDGSYPTVLTRGYSAGGLSNHAGRFHKAGYAFVSQQCRGGGGSDGTRFFPDDKDGYWKAISMRHGNKYAQVSIPVYCMAGWRDYYAGAAFESYLALTSLGHSPDVRVRIGDHGHSGAPDFAETIRWLDYHLQGIDNGIEEEPPIKIQVRHGRWRMENQWPLAGTRFTNYYLSSPDGSRIRSLDLRPPGKQSPTRYSYDPDDPVPTLGANGSHFPVSGLIAVGPTDQRSNENRQDVCVFTTPELEQDTEVIGPVEARLYAASSAKDTDFTIKLIDVYPDGKALNVTEGLVRARFRNSIWDAPSLIEPGKIYEYRIELLPVAIVFRKGHRIRIHVSSSSWPLWDRNQNTGNPIGMDAEMIVAHQTIYHDAEHLSRIILPVTADNSAR